ncbi:aminotransferase class I/II-fold pyridoxal phosphate-dependent enzyme [Bacillus benzoevorans]|uniref:8-amino-7-oxononanoate synthase n=1 Tax=Bacillus benzoevorans TaxID=1456 RepID=A0A7X0HVR3_9BACI|nr:pyridoxal phosphate-dependent aminotransferase family protein [Bacillus benzoevorans]MBB6446822.1 8-amino-7-oxononanoate synthase [Bacillus benzoevorans]
MDVFKKCFDYEFVKFLKANNRYPYFEPIQERHGTEATVRSKDVMMLGSNDYLGLSTDSRVVEAALAATVKYGTSVSGSRLLNGTLSLHEELEERLARFLKREKAIVFSTGYQTNLGTISALLGRNDVAIIDRNAHASIVDGTRLGFGKLKRFKHNDTEDLEKILQSFPENIGKLIIVDGVYSMEGNLAKLKEIVQLKKKYKARLLVDDAHGIGILGENGRGTCEHFGIENEIDIITGTFSKSFGSLGGFAAGDKDVIDYIKHNGRSMIFSASMTPASTAAVLMSLEVMETEPGRRRLLQANAERFSNHLTDLGFNIGHSETPIIPIYIDDTMRTFQFWQELMNKGVYTNPIIAPAVPEGNELLRTSVMATHTEQQLNHVLNILEDVTRENGFLAGKVQV